MVQLEGELVSVEEIMPAKVSSRAVQPVWPVPKAVVWTGAVLAFAGREILPRVADLLLDVLARRASRPSTSAGGVAAEPGTRQSANSLTGGGGRQHRQRQRRGRR